MGQGADGNAERLVVCLGVADQRNQYPAQQIGLAGAGRPLNQAQGMAKRHLEPFLLRRIQASNLALSAQPAADPFLPLRRLGKIPRSGKQIHQG
ncbi:hypothetical protein H206_02444 [Candidatus Electrothrix aarhusensis]|uniref:Uncharacterized protein n=1 Tax=Candidatus Electrothrix aarhusensis TaxID=1859131 RepID=A0A444ISD6_9BACT|nr:hypothetical protein H206_02444 [Candidatus Electrothrix aarhusensis]